MLQVELFIETSEQKLVDDVNYFLKQIDECLINDIKYSTTAFFDGEEYVPVFEVLIIYICR